MVIEALPLESIVIDPRVQQREKINEDRVAEYAEILSANPDAMPPGRVYREGGVNLLAGGFHRYDGHKAAGLKAMKVEVVPGTLRDAILFAVGDNANHGLSRTNGDKRKTVTTMLTDEMVSRDEKGRPWSDREIARLCYVSPQTVGNVRASLSNLDSETGGTRTYTTKHGTTSTMKTGRIGRGKKTDPDANKPTGAKRDADEGRPDGTIATKIPLPPLSDEEQALVDAAVNNVLAQIGKAADATVAPQTATDAASGQDLFAPSPTNSSPPQPNASATVVETGKSVEQPKWAEYNAAIAAIVAQCEAMHSAVNDLHDMPGDGGVFARWIDLGHWTTFFKNLSTAFSSREVVRFATKQERMTLPGDPVVVYQCDLKSLKGRKSA